MDLFSSLRAGIEQELALQGSLVPGCDFSGRVRARIPRDSPVRSLSTLEQVAGYVEHTLLAPIDANRTQAVPGTGNPEADLVLIGEAPGADEDAQGLPFVGQAGQLLTRILQAINLEREEVFITNVLKTRPPHNRNPSADEIAAHIPVLYQQLSLIRPKLLCCLGKIAGNALLENTLPLGVMRRTVRDFCGIPLFVTYHPAALLRNPQWKRPTWEDVQRLRRKYDELRAT